MFTLVKMQIHHSIFYSTIHQSFVYKDMLFSAYVLLRFSFHLYCFVSFTAFLLSFVCLSFLFTSFKKIYMYSYFSVFSFLINKSKAWLSFCFFLNLTQTDVSSRVENTNIRECAPFPPSHPRLKFKNF